VPRPSPIQNDIRKLAREIYEERRACFAEPPEYRKVCLAEFPGFDRAFYDQTAATLMADGFRLVGDFEDVRASARRPDQRAVERLLCASEGWAWAVIWQHRSRGRLRLQELGGDYEGRTTNLRYVALHTAFSDDSLLITSNTKGRGFLEDDPVPGLTRQALTPNAPAPAVLKLHRATVEQMAAPPGARTVIPARSFVEAAAADLRIRAKMRAYLEGIGFVDVSRELAQWRKYLSGDVLKILEAELEALKLEVRPT
jgi:hypothetical protein